MPAPVTILCMTRHGHGTAKLTLDGIYADRSVPFELVYVDLGSPPEVAAFLDDEAAARGFTLLRHAVGTSRQTARKAALERVRTPFTAILDNNVVVRPGWLETLLAAQADTGAALVSPHITSVGGYSHYSGGEIVYRRSVRDPRSWTRAQVYRFQNCAEAPFGMIAEAGAMSRREVDFVESHSCLAQTEALREPGVLEEAMHNAHTMLYAGYKLKRDLGGRVVFEPRAEVTITPVAFGYDLPWMLECYMDESLLQSSYRTLEELLGPGPGSSFDFARTWHAHHFAHLALSMLEGDRLDRTDQAAADEAVDSGYDLGLPVAWGERLSTELLPWIEAHHPSLAGRARKWLESGS